VSVLLFGAVGCLFGKSVCPPAGRPWETAGRARCSAAASPDSAALLASGLRWAGAGRPKAPAVCRPKVPRAHRDPLLAGGDGNTALLRTVSASEQQLPAATGASLE